MSSPARKAIWGDKAARIEANLRALDPELAQLVIDVAYDDVLSRPGLDMRTRELLAITALMSVGSESELKTHILGALANGSSLDELREVILQAAMFLGFPRAIAAMKVLKGVQNT